MPSFLTCLLCEQEGVEERCLETDIYTNPYVLTFNIYLTMRFNICWHLLQCFSFP